MLTALIIVFAAVPLASFSWGLRGHFRASEGMPTAMRALTAASSLSALLFLVLVVTGDVDGVTALVFVILACASAALFWWAVRTTKRLPPCVAHSQSDPDLLYETGPYAFVRHPFYLAYCLFWLGTAVAAGGPQWLAAALLIGWYFVIARAEEERFFKSLMAASYIRYRRRTGMIVPRVRGMLRW
ncbi:methyltransferase family protein [Jiella mangrovi]|uniref:Isoprenylcysteine carboxylmethyltransferase family protein n=1 Tax=Jiella mangrovi TaxID=2821407 RepID=A0ABS4BDQ1_9HYPH|nr:isoprenylcysteine carboxylmethyltransferase family protein [Jiella mangrovi]MBP0614647.1 isoprenylcysteine carboxylmethyltransferase family protein [Jiella mangrovi]